MRKGNIKRGLAFVLCMALMFEGTGVTALAEMSQVNVEYETGVSSGDASASDAISAGDVVSVGDLVSAGDCVSEGDVVSDGNTVSDGDTAVVETAEMAADNIASGTYLGMDWVISGNGELTISGTFDASSDGESWKNYKEIIVSVKITASDVKWTNSWFSDFSNLQSVNLSGFDASKVTDMGCMFMNCTNLKAVNFEGIDSSQVTNMNGMFWGCSSLENLDLSDFDTSLVTDMSYAFYECGNVKNIDLRNFDTSQVTNMSEMFWGCNSLAELDLSSFDMSNVKNSVDMFPGNESNATSLVKINTPKNLTLDVSIKGIFLDEEGVEYIKLPKGSKESVLLQKPSDLIASGICSGRYWNIYNDGLLSIIGAGNNLYSGVKWEEYEDYITKAKVTDIGYNVAGLFSGLSKLKRVDLTDLDTSQVTDMSYMFQGCSSLEELDTSDWDTSQVTDMRSMFNGCKSLKNLDVSNFDTSQVTNMNAMFRDCSSLKNLDVSKFNTSQVTHMGGMFNGCSVLTSLDVSKFNTSKVTSMNAMFNECSQLTEINVSDFDTSLVEDMSLMFRKCGGLKSIDVSNFNTENVIDMESVFAECENLSELDVSNFDTGKVTDIGGMFGNCHVLTSINLSGFNTSQVTDMSGMFNGCWKLENLDISNFDTSQVENFSLMFYSCYGLTSLDTSNYNTSKATNMSLMFQNCSNLNELNLSGFDMTKVTTADGMLKNMTSLQTLRTPTNLTMEVSLPHTMCDESGKEYTTIPTGQATSITLTKKATTGGEDEKDEPVTDFVLASIPDQAYTGKAIKPEVTVTYGNLVLEPGKDYTVSYKNNTNAAFVTAKKAPTVTVKGKGSYTGSITAKFNIIAKEITSDNTTVAEMVVTANNKVQNPKTTVTVDGKKLTANKDYALEYPDTVEGAYKNAGTYNVIIKGKGNYQGSVPATMTILSKEQVKASQLKVGKIASCDYVEGTPATPTPAVTYKGKTLVAGKDYALSYENNDKAGKATLIITGLMNTDADGTFVAGSVKKTFTIKGTALKKAKVNYDNKATYTGSEICPAVTLTVGETTLRPGKDYTVEYTKNINVGKGTIVLTGCGGYTGAVKKTFTIQADTTVADKLAVSFVSGKAEAAYVQSGAKPEIIVALGNTVLELGKDYTVSYKNNKALAASDAKKAPTITIKGKGNYKFTKTVTFAIVQKSLADEDITVTAADKFVGKKGLLSAPVVTDANGKKLKAKKDYTVSYTVNGAAFDGKSQVEAGTVVTVTVEGTGKNYIGKASTTYRVAAKDIAKTSIVVQKQIYNGGEVVFTEAMIKSGAIKITDKSTKKDLVYGVDYIITGYKNNNKKGSATVTIQGIGEYGGTKNVKFSIVSKKFWE